MTSYKVNTIPGNDLFITFIFKIVQIVFDLVTVACKGHNC